MKLLEQLAQRLSTLDMVDTVALSGSMTSPIHDADSDYDLYIYSRSDVPRDARERIIREFSNDYTVGNAFFEEGDEFFTDAPRRTTVDMMYRRLDWAQDEIDWVWNKGNARLGYTTCFLYNLKTSKPLFDRDGRFGRLVAPLGDRYPEKLRRNIIDKNHAMLRGHLEAPYFTQIELAVNRGDMVSMNHRVTALLASYFDILFAYNRQLHPGEKKLMPYAHMLCERLPERFDEDMARTIQAVGNRETLLPSLTTLLDSLDRLLAQD